MALKSKLSIIGLYEHDDTIFNGMQLPAEMSRNIMIDYIYMECADLELLYPEPDVMKKLISSWSVARLHAWERLYESTVQSYNMIHNFDRYEDWTDNGSASSNASASGTQSGNASGSETVTVSKPGYNTSAGYVMVEQTGRTGYSSSSGTSSSNSNESSTTAGRHVGHLYGNIGVTTAAQMLQGERDINAWDVYEAITQEFKEKFCVLVY